MLASGPDLALSAISPPSAAIASARSTTWAMTAALGQRAEASLSAAARCAARIAPAASFC